MCYMLPHCPPVEAVWIYTYTSHMLECLVPHILDNIAFILLVFSDVLSGNGFSV